MKKRFSKVSLVLLSSTMLLSFLLPVSDVSVSASENNSALKMTGAPLSTNILSSTDINQINEFITFNDLDSKFEINPSIQDKIDLDKLIEVQKIVEETNNQILLALKDNNVNVWAETPDGTEVRVTKYQTRAYGKNDIKFYWNFAIVWLSKGTVNNVGAAASIGGIVIPNPVIRTMLGILGVAAGWSPHGIVFDYNYFTYSFWNLRFQ